MNLSKKREERVFLDLVLSADEIEAPTQVIEHEKPDFLLKYPALVVGVEVTVLHRPGLSRGSRNWEGACESVLKAAENTWGNRSLPPVHVSVTFNKSYSFPKNSWEKWGGRLVDLVHGVLPDPGRQTVIGVGPPHLIAPIKPPPELQSIIVTRDVRKQSSLWTLSAGGALPPLEPDTLREIISKKDRLIPDYRSSADSIWLIIGLAQFRYSSDYSFRNSPALDGKYDSRFDRLFFVPRAERCFFELDRES